MAGERDDHDDRIIEGIRDLAGDDRGLDSPPPELWVRIAGALDDPAPEDPPITAPPELWDRIAAEVRDLGGRPELPATDPTVSPIQEVPHPGRRHHRGRWVAATAAVVLALVAVAAVAVSERGGDAGTTEVVARAALSGDGLDPGGDGSGSAELLQEDGAWEVAIRAADLPAPASGTYYEAWLLGTGPDQVQSLGALDVTGGFVVPDGLDLDDFPLVDVSIEPIDGNPAHSARSVLRGRLEPA